MKILPLSLQIIIKNKKMFPNGEKHPNYVDGGCNPKTNKFYRCWAHILQRCNNPNDSGYEGYGGRGIKCLWKSYEHFKADMYESYLRHKKKHPNDTSIDRIDNNKNYCKENCRWATQKQQMSNTRRSVKVFYDGKYLTYSQLAPKSNVSRDVFLTRIKKGWTVEQALTIPKGWQRPKKEKIDYPFLNERQKLILRLRNEGRPLELIGDAIGITRERVRQLEKRAREIILDKTS